jgi:hypothetical protein
MKEQMMNNNTNVNNDYNESKIGEIKQILDSVQNNLQQALLLSLEEINKNYSTEKEVFALWGDYVKKLSDYFMVEVEKSGNQQLGKNVIKQIMFKRF